ncbi:TPA: signal peptidase II [Candidatus Poribacteria bacterium]|nr:signal peptidase II [Candidatus Poribacteria bacterium]
MLKDELKKISPLLLTAFPVVVIDQVSKLIIQSSIQLNHSKPILKGIFDIVYYKNDGAAFGILKGMNSIFIVIIIIAIGFILMYYRSFRYNSWMKISLGFLLGGALGNLIDRIRIGHVIDFIRLGVNSYWWPAFNLADASVCVGAVMLLAHMFSRKREHENLKNT